MVQKLNNTNIN